MSSNPSSTSNQPPASPWSQVVRGGESGSSPSTPNPMVPPPSSSPPSPPPPSSLIAADEEIPSPSKEMTSLAGAEFQPESSDNGNAGKKPAWNRPSNVATVEAASSVIGGASSWPALHESTKGSLKSPSSDPLKAFTDVSVPSPQGSGMSLTSSPSSSHKHVSSNGTHPNPATKVTGPTRQRSMRRGSGSGSPSYNALANGGFSQSEVSVAEPIPNDSLGKSVNSAAESSGSRTNTHKGGFGPQSHSINEHHQLLSPSRRGNGGPHPRGDGSHHHGYGGRRDQDRGNHEWGQQRSFGPRDAHGQTQRVPSRPYIRAQPPVPPPYIPPPLVPMRPYGPGIVYPDVPSHMYLYPSPHPEFRPMPPMFPIPSMIFPVLPDPHLTSKIVSQIEYYFSDENLVKDTYLRMKMDDQGWVPVAVIATFKKVAQLTNDLQLILQALQSSSVVEVQGDKLRRRDSWTRWLMPRAVQSPTGPSPPSLHDSGHDMLAANLQGVTLDENTRPNSEVGISSPGDSSGKH